MRILRLLLLGALLSVLAACGGGDEDGDAPDGSATAGPAGTSNGGAASGDGTSVDLLAGVVWERVDGPASDGLSTAYEAYALADGFLAVGRSRAPEASEATLAIWRGDADGTNWTLSEIDPAVGAFSLGEVAERDGVVVAIGNEHAGCFSSDDQPLSRVCTESAARALWSDDGGASWQGASTALGETGTFASAVVATADGFLAAGRDEADGTSWQLVVWASADGTSWREVSRFSDPEWPLYAPDLQVAGDSALLLGQRAFCSEPHLNGNEWVLGSPFRRQSRIWTSDAVGSSWTELDLVSLELTDAMPSTMDCEDFNGSRALDDAVTEGLFLPGDGSVVWASSGGIWTSDDGARWAPLGDSSLSPQSAWSLRRVPGGWARVEFASLVSAVVVSAQTSTDLLTWTDQSDLSPPLPAVVPPERAGLSTGRMVRSVAASDAVAVAVGEDLTGAEGPRSAFYRSVATTLTVPAAGDCEPAAGFACPRGDLSSAELAGLDLSGADLSGANLRRANLAGANLSGANLVGADLSSADLTGANLTGARLARAELRSAVLDGANFTDADLRDASGLAPLASATWSGALMHGVSLRDDGDGVTWDLSGVDLLGGTISLKQDGVSLVGTILRGAFLTGSYVDADFSDADLTGASFSTADLTGAKFAGATWDETTGWYPKLCPDGFERPTSSFPNVDCEGHFIDR